MNNKIEKNRNDITIYLKSIFNYYKEKYNLTGDLIFDNNETIHFRPINQNIYLRYKEIFYLYKIVKNRTLLFKNTKEMLLIILWHEICHAIDYKNGILQEEFQAVNYDLYNIDRYYHNTRPFEIRADNFAKEEFLKIVKDEKDSYSTIDKVKI